LQQLTRSVPIVFANVADPVGQGFVASLPRPAGNILSRCLCPAAPTRCLNEAT
jgi:hypothetical protein